MKKLTYYFDLFYDIKTEEQASRELNYWKSRSEKYKRLTKDLKDFKKFVRDGNDPQQFGKTKH